MTALLAESLGAAPLDPDTLWRLARPATLAASPDGRWVALTLMRWDMASNAADGDIWLIAADGRRPARRLTGAVTQDGNPFWSPDSRRLGYIASRDQGPAQIELLDLTSGESRTATALPVAVRRARWHPDGRRIVFEAPTFPDLGADFAAVGHRLDEERAAPARAYATESRLLRYGDRWLTDGQVPHLFELSLDDGAIRDLMPGFDRLTGLDGFEWDLAPDGGELAYSANRTDPPYRELDFDLFALDLGSGQTRQLTPDSPGADTRPIYLPGGRDLLFGRQPRPGVASDFTRLMLLDRGRGETREIAAALEAPKSAWRGSRDGTAALFAAEWRGRVHLYEASLAAGGSVRRLASGGTIESLDVAGTATVFVRHGFRQPPELFRVERGVERRLSTFNARRIAGVDFGPVREVYYPGAGGAPVQMWLVLPPDHSPRRRWPLLLLAHGGPFTAWNDAFSWRWNAQLLAGRGYVVALPNWHGSTGFGQAFADAILGNPGEKPVADMLAALDGLLARDDIDPKRVAVMGGSYGGYLAALLTAKTDRFAAAVVHAGIYDLAGQFASDTHWDRPGTYGGAPWTDPAALDRWSPSRLVPRMATPTLILHGERDFRVPLSQGINLHGALSGKGVPSRIVVFADEGHWIQSPQASRRWHDEVFGWLERHLGPTRSSAPRR